MAYFFILNHISLRKSEKYIKSASAAVIFDEKLEIL